MLIRPRSLYRTLSRGFAALLPALFGAGAAFAAGSPSPQMPLLAAPPGFSSSAVPRSADADAATYQRCLALAEHDPAAARKLAESWHARGGAHPADHCFAVALIGLKQYKEAATRLETLAQAAQAWLLDGDPDRAYAADSAALHLQPDDPDLLVDRAEAAGSAGRFAKAIADLDRVLKAEPGRVDALIYRASAYRERGRLDLALADVEAALKHAPDSVPALLERGNIRRLRGDAAGAREDWGRVSALAPGSAAEAAAQANIARLAIPSATVPAARPGTAR